MFSAAAEPGRGGGCAAGIAVRGHQHRQAADPTSVLGARKRLAELIVAALSGEGMQGASVRSAMCLVAAGPSCTSLAAEDGHGQHIPSRHPDVYKYFMTISRGSGRLGDREQQSWHRPGDLRPGHGYTPVRIVDLVSRS